MAININCNKQFQGTYPGDELPCFIKRLGETAKRIITEYQATVARPNFLILGKFI